MNLSKWKPKRTNQLSDPFNIEHPFMGLTLFPEFREFGNLLNQGWEPAVDIAQEKDQFVISVDLPGIDKKDIKLSVENNVLTISGERRQETKTKEHGYSRVERSFGSFSRSFDLGANVSSSKVKANYKDGVLEVIVPKSEQAQTQYIDIT